MLPHGDTHVLSSHIGGAPVEIATANAILRKTTVGAKADTEMICGRLMFDAAVSAQLPHSAQTPVRAYNGQRLHLRPSLVRSTKSESRDTKYELDQGREIAKIDAVLFCEGNQAIAPVSSEFGARWSWSWSGRIESPIF